MAFIPRHSWKNSSSAIQFSEFEPIELFSLEPLKYVLEKEVRSRSPLLLQQYEFHTEFDWTQWESKAQSKPIYFKWRKLNKDH